MAPSFRSIFVSWTSWLTSWFTDCTLFWTLLVPTSHYSTCGRYSTQVDWHLEITWTGTSALWVQFSMKSLCDSPEANVLCDLDYGLDAECVAPGFESHCIFQPPGYRAVGSYSVILLVAAVRLSAIPELNRFPLFYFLKFYKNLFEPNWQHRS